METSSNREKLYEHYREKYKQYIEINKEIYNIKTKYDNFIKLCVDSYYEKNMKIPLSKYVNYKLSTANKQKNWENLNNINNVKILVRKAKKNDDNAKKELITRYMYLVENELMKFNATMDKEDSLQLGYVFLIEKINSYISNDMKVDISKYLRLSVARSLKGYIKKEEIKQQKLRMENFREVLDEFTKSVSELELIDYIENCDSILATDKLVYYRIILGQTQSEIAKETNVSRQLISAKIKRNESQIKRFYKIK